MDGEALKVLHRIKACRLIPIVRFRQVEQAEKIAHALVAAQVDIIEFPLTSEHALTAIEKISDAFGDTMVVGAGTVLDGASARSSILAGARFIVSPATKTDVIGMCNRYSTIACPGALTPTEILFAWESGADLVKIFPCESVGGASYIRSLKTPYPHIELVPVGGVTPENAADFIAAGSAALGVGSGIISSRALDSFSKEDITRNASRFIDAIKKARSAPHD
jgi:2-dehydro-3-deoxyphosphogluconate aldolase/(4S)-4-hydroxy-2-oxoglutarate aldolase